MTSPPSPLASTLAEAVAEFHRHADPMRLSVRLQELIANATPDALVIAARDYLDDPNVVAPIYERIVAEQPTNARALVILANAYWLQGRGPDAVGELASRAIEARPSERGAWHLWALSESNPRDRVARWRQVSERFPEDVLALANVADNAAAVAGAESDYEMLDLAVATYEVLVERAQTVEERNAVETALNALRGWKF